MSASLLIYGANGYTARLILQQALSAGLSPILAGRSEKVKTLAHSMRLESRCFDLRNPIAIEQNLTGVNIVLNLAGPFSETARPLVEACLVTGTHYLDIAGEVPEFEVILAFDQAARAAGVMLMPGVGFGVVPTDCLAVHLKQRLPQAKQLTLAFATEGGVSQGTLKTVMHDLPRVGVIRKDGQLKLAKAAEKTIKLDFGQGLKTLVLNPWRADLLTAALSTEIPNIETFSFFPPPLPWLMAHGQRWLEKPGIQQLLQRLIGFLPVGPTATQLQTGKTFVWGQVQDATGRTYTAQLQGPEAYRFTALTAIAVVQQIMKGKAPAGFQTPAQAYGPDLGMGLPGVSFQEK